MRRGSKLSLTRALSTASAPPWRLEDGHDAAQRCPAADQRGVPAESGKRGADRRRAAIIVAPGRRQRRARRGPPPQSKKCLASIWRARAAISAGALAGRQRQPPDYAFAVIAQQRDVGDLAPDQRRIGAVQLLGGAEPGELAAQRGAAMLDRGAGSLDAQQRDRAAGCGDIGHRRAASERGGKMGGSRDFVRRVERFRHGRDGSVIVEAEDHDGSRLLRPRQDLDRDLAQHGESAERASHQLAEIIAGDVLHDLARRP